MYDNNLPQCSDCRMIELSKNDVGDLIDFLRDVSKNYEHQRCQLWIQYLKEKLI
jgi:hypothetical protein